MRDILFTGGLGDVFAVEARMSDAEKYDVRNIYLATPGAKFIKQALAYHHLWYDKKVFDVLTKEQIGTFAPSKYCIHSYSELIQTCQVAGLPCPPALVDYSIIKIFAEIRNKQRPYNGTGFAFPRIQCDLVCDFKSTSGDFRIDGRSFTDKEIAAVKEYAYKNKLCLIELGEGKTTFEQYVGYVLGCREFIGIDSAASILAVIDKVSFKDKKVFIRSTNKAWYAHRAEWYAPDAMDFSFSSEYVTAGF